MIELSLLKVLSKKSNFDSYKHLINTKFLSSQSLLILQDYRSWFANSEQDIDFSLFKTRFFIEWHPNLDDKSVEQYKEILHLIDSKEDQDCLTVIRAFEQQEFYNNIQSDIQRNVDMSTLVTKVNSFCDKMELYDIENKDFTADMDLNLALDSTDRSNGLKWRLESLREHFNGGLIKGDFGIVAGFTDMGKSSFVASEITYMAEQLEGDQYIAWLNTEGSWEQLIPRVYCAALNCTVQDLRKFQDSAIIKYTNLMKGDRNRIKIMNFQRKSTKDVELLIKRKPPSLIVFDLLDSIRGFDKYIKTDGGVTERYGQLYQWAREIATQYCPILAISQLNGDGNNEAYPSITSLRGSRVDKQSAATFQLVIGGMEGNSTERFLSMPKNKVSSNKNWRTQVQFDPIRCRFN